MEQGVARLHGSRSRGISELMARQPASVVKLMSFMFSERLCLKTKVESVGGRRLTSASGLHMSSS